MGLIRTDFNPNVLDFNKLISLLDKYGFSNDVTHRHDRKRICELYENDGFITMYADNEPIGFTAWRGELQWAIVDYKWLHPDYRGQGLGRLFAQLVYQEFLRHNIFYILVEPASLEGRRLAKSLEFKSLRDTDYRFDTNLYYKFLQSNRSMTQQSDSGYELLIWHDWNNQNEAAQIYRIDDTMESEPIISIVDSDAYVELRRDGSPIKKGISKRFFSESELQCYGLLYFNTNLSDCLKMI